MANKSKDITFSHGSPHLQDRAQVGQVSAGVKVRWLWLHRYVEVRREAREISTRTLSWTQAKQGSQHRWSDI